MFQNLARMAYLGEGRSTQAYLGDNLRGHGVQFYPGQQALDPAQDSWRSAHTSGARKCLSSDFLCMGSNFYFRKHGDTNVRNIAFLSNKYACYVYCLYKRFLLKYDKKIASIVWLIGSFLAFS